MARTFTRRNMLQLAGVGTLLLSRGTSAQASSIVLEHIDAAWFRQILAGETEHWLKAAATPSGFFQVSLDRQWRPVGDQIATLTSQNRQMFVMASGYELTHNNAYLEALIRGTDFLLTHFRDSQYGGLFYSVSPDGNVIDDRKDSYGTAFAIFGLSHAARVTGENRYWEAALETWYEMRKNLRYETGFFKTTVTRDYSQQTGRSLPFQPRAAGPVRNSQDAMMHLFEALLALHDTTQSNEIYKDAEDLTNNIYTNLFQDSEGCLYERYDEDWKLPPVSERGSICIGHQFEWAFLLSKAFENGFPQRYMTIGERLLEYAMKVGYDRENGGLFVYSHFDQIRGKSKRKCWWEQAELLRALMHYAALRDRPDLWEPFNQSLESVKRNFIDAEYGGWYDNYDPENPRKGKALYKGSPAQVGYHVCGMYAEAVRLTGGY